MTEKKDDRLQIELKTPITIAGAVVSVVKLRKPKARDFRATFTKTASETLSQQQLMMDLAAQLCELTPDEFDELSLPDMTAIIQKVEDFV